VVTNPSDPIDRAALRELAPGTSQVQSVIVRAQETLLRLGYPGGLHVVASLPPVPQHGVESHRSLEAMRPLAVRMNNRPAAVECSVLGTTRTGPRRVRISMAHALELCASGVHTVFCTD
jgi:hypothetical protein